MQIESKQKLNILQISSSDKGGGAERVAWNLFDRFRSMGHSSKLAVGYKHLDDQDINEIPNRADNIFDSTNILLQRLVGLAGEFLGVENFYFPGSRCLLKLQTEVPDLVHAHNLHGNYFDLRILTPISQKFPVVLTLHDAWLLSGHCAHSFDCDRWLYGCGECPNWAVYPPIRRDASAYNWRRKRNIYASCRLNIVTPSRWLMDKVEQSMLQPAIVTKRVIPNGVDMAIFRPGDKCSARAKLGIPDKAKILLFAANGIRKNEFKDYKTIRSAIECIAERSKSSEVIFWAIGEGCSDEQIECVKIHYIPFIQDSSQLALYYQAADIFLHAAHADTFPNTILEALACGTPVVATSVGGVPEQIEDGVTGFLVPASDAIAMAQRCSLLLENEGMTTMMGEYASDFACKNFNLTSQAEKYLEWYRVILHDWQEKHAQTIVDPKNRTIV